MDCGGSPARARREAPRPEWNAWWAYDTFVARWPDSTIEPAYVIFALDAQGKPDRISMKAFSPVADFSFDYHDLAFTRVP